MFYIDDYEIESFILFYGYIYSRVGGMLWKALCNQE